MAWWGRNSFFKNYAAPSLHGKRQKVTWEQISGLQGLAGVHQRQVMEMRGEETGAEGVLSFTKYSVWVGMEWGWVK